MREGAGRTDVSPFQSVLFAFKPRQVLLAEKLRRNKEEALHMAKKLENSVQLKPEDETILAYTVALWLENRGFCKVLKRFLSAAQIQDDVWKVKALNLNEIFSKYQEICDGVQKDLKPQTKREETKANVSEHNEEKNAVASEDFGNKKKKKKRNIEDAASNGPGRISEEKAMDEIIIKSNDSTKEENQKFKASKESIDEKVCDLTVEQSSKMQKDKKKKKSKYILTDEKIVGVMPETTVEKHEDLPPRSVISKKESEMVDETKDKKKKKRKTDILDNDKNCENKSTVVSDKAGGLESEENKVKVEEKVHTKKATASGNLSGSAAELESKPEQISVNAVEEEVIKSKKASKKRKRSADEEDESLPGHEEAVVSKLKKSKGSDENKQATPLEANGHADIKNKAENLSSNGNAKDDLPNNGVHQISQSKSAGKKHSNSQPKTVNPFQRVKIDEVEFVNERLQDNSYWAKDGAESGYGAKAQEKLGQVKGRDFRHEKTKKKRGSYRGGQIDLQSHSIKFNYSDEE